MAVAATINFIAYIKVVLLCDRTDILGRRFLALEIVIHIFLKLGDDFSSIAT